MSDYRELLEQQVEQLANVNKKYSEEISYILRGTRGIEHLIGQTLNGGISQYFMNSYHQGSNDFLGTKEMLPFYEEYVAPKYDNEQMREIFKLITRIRYLDDIDSSDISQEILYDYIETQLLDQYNYQDLYEELEDEIFEIYCNKYGPIDYEHAKELIGDSDELDQCREALNSQRPWRYCNFNSEYIDGECVNCWNDLPSIIQDLFESVWERIVNSNECLYELIRDIADNGFWAEDYKNSDECPCLWECDEDSDFGYGYSRPDMAPIQRWDERSIENIIDNNYKQLLSVCEKLIEETYKKYKIENIDNLEYSDINEFLAKNKELDKDVTLFEFKAEIENEEDSFRDSIKLLKKLENAKDGVVSQAFKDINEQLLTKTYPMKYITRDNTKVRITEMVHRKNDNENVLTNITCQTTLNRLIMNLNEVN